MKPTSKSSPKSKRARNRTAEQQARASKPVNDALARQDGILITAGGPGALSVRECTSAGQMLAPGDRYHVRPSVVEAASAKRPTPVPGLAQPAPSSLLWAEVRPGNGEDATVRIDSTGLALNAARWGRPVLLACHVVARSVARAKVKESKAGAPRGCWRAVPSDWRIELNAGDCLLLVATGHGVRVNPEEVFPLLFAALKGAVDAAD